MDAIKECLLIDDDQDDQEIFLMCVRSVDQQTNCRALSDPIEALSMLVSNVDYVPDFIFIDVNMPKMDGIDCLKGLKNIARLSQTKMFMYSTSSSSNVIEETKKIGASGYLIKPVKLTELKEHLSAIFETHQSQNN